MDVGSYTLGQSTIIQLLTADDNASLIKQLVALSQVGKHICEALKQNNGDTLVTRCKASCFDGNFFHLLLMNALFAVCARARVCVNVCE